MRSRQKLVQPLGMRKRVWNVFEQQFHAALAMATRNLTLAKIVIPLQHKASRFWAYAMTEDTAAERIAEVERHRVLAECVARGDADAAYQAMLAVIGAFFGNRAAA